MWILFVSIPNGSQLQIIWRIYFGIPVSVALLTLSNLINNCRVQLNSSSWTTYNIQRLRYNRHAQDFELLYLLYSWISSISSYSTFNFIMLLYHPSFSHTSLCLSNTSLCIISSPYSIFRCWLPRKHITSPSPISSSACQFWSCHLCSIVSQLESTESRYFNMHVPILSCESMYVSVHL